MEMLLTILALVLIVILTIACYYLYRQFINSSHLIDLLEKQIKLHSQSISGLTAGALGVDRRLRSLHDSEKELSHRQDNIENRNPSEVPYDQAIALVQKGSSASQLMSELGLSESEAKLIQQLHGAK